MTGHCDTCRWYDVFQQPQVGHDGERILGKGFCRAVPPAAPRWPNGYPWPEVNNLDWCKLHEPREGTE